MNGNWSVMNKIEDVLSALADQDALSLHMYMHELCIRLNRDPIGDEALCIGRACFLADRINDSDAAAINCELKKIMEVLNGPGS